MTERCPGGWWGRHKLEPRFETLPAQQITPEHIHAISEAVYLDDAVEAIGSLAAGGEKYLFDICLHCGQTFPPADRGAD